MRGATSLLCLAVVLGLAPHALLQAQDGPAFEVVSIRPSDPDVSARRSIVAGGRFTASNVTLRELVLRAHDLYDWRLEGGPDWQLSQRFDILARASDPVAGMAAMAPIIRALLADRFRLKVRPHSAWAFSAPATPATGARTGVRRQSFLFSATCAAGDGCARGAARLAARVDARNGRRSRDRQRDASRTRLMGVAAPGRRDGPSGPSALSAF